LKEEFDEAIYVFWSNCLEINCMNNKEAENIIKEEAK